MAKQALIRDLIINIKADKLRVAAKEAETLVNSLVDTATSAEILNTELLGVNSTLKAINKTANSTADVFKNFTLGRTIKAELNAILEGINRIKASAKDLKGLSIGIDVRVDNLTKLQNDVSKSIQGLDVSINLKVGNLAATNTRLQDIANSLQDAAAGVNLLNSELSNTSSLIKAIKVDAEHAASALTKVAISKNLENGLDDVLHALNNITEEIVQLNLDSRDAFHAMEASAERLDDSLGAINSTLNKSKFIQKSSREETKKHTESISILSKTFATLGINVGKATEGHRNHTRIMGDLAKLAGPIPAAFAIISAHVWALTAAFDQLAQGDRLNRLNEMGTIIGANIGVPVQKVAAIMVEATNGAISFESAMKKAANASAYGFSTAELEKMTEVARRASVVMGVEMDDALNRIIRGVSKQEIELLDELGITIRLTEAQNAYAKSIGTTADKLSSYQKQTAYLNAVLAQSEKSFGFLTEENLDATGIETLGAKFDSLTNKVRQTIAALTNDILQKFLGWGGAQDTSESKTEAVVSGLEATLESYKQALASGDIKSMTKLLQGETIDDTGFKKATEALRKLREENILLKKSIKDAYSVNIYSSSFGGQMEVATSALGAQTNKIIQEQTESINDQEAALLLLDETRKKFQVKFAETLGIDSPSLTTSTNLIKDLGDMFSNLAGSEQSSKGAAESFTQSLNKTAKVTNSLGEGFDAYYQSLKDVSSVYDQLDAIEEKFPEMPQSTLDRLKEYVDQMAKLAGFTSRQDVQTRLGASSALRQFDEGAGTRELTYSEMSGQRGGVSGSNELAVSKAKLDAEKQHLQALEEEARSRANAKENELAILEAKKAIVGYQTEYNNALDSYLQNARSIQQLEAQSTDLLRQYGQSGDNGSVERLKEQLSIKKQQLAEDIRISRNDDTIAKTRYDILETQLQLNAAELTRKQNAADLQLALDSQMNATASFEAYMQGSSTATIAQKQAVDELNTSIQKYKNLLDAFNSGDSGVKQSQVLQAGLEVEQNKLNQIRAMEENISFTHDEDVLEIKKQQLITGIGEHEVLEKQIAAQKQYVANLENSHLSQTKIKEEKLKELELEKQLIDLQNQRHRDLINGSTGAIQGDVMATYTSTKGLDEENARLARQADGLNNIATAFDQLAQYDQPFANVVANLNQMAIAIQDNASAMQIASMAGQTISAMFAMNGAAATDAIEQQIAAEQKRDGKSSESLAKIRALEAKKIEVTRKSATQQIIIQTAVGVANALAMGNPMVGIPMAIAVAAMGMQALKSAQNSAEASLANLSSTDTTTSLTLGDRTNKVDTAQTANSGEISYIQGASGTGGIQNFTPKAAGGDAFPGHAYLAGEKGPELIIPKVNSTIYGNSELGSITNNNSKHINLNIQTLDSASFEDLVLNRPDLFRKAVENSLNANGKSLE